MGSRWQWVLVVTIALLSLPALAGAQIQGQCVANCDPPAPQNTQAVPPHMHRTPSGQLEPDPGYVWVNPSDPNDLRVRPRGAADPKPQPQ